MYKNNSNNFHRRPAERHPELGMVCSHIFDTRAEIIITKMPIERRDDRGRFNGVDDPLFYGKENGKVKPFLREELVLAPEEELEDMQADWNSEDEKRFGREDKSWMR